MKVAILGSTGFVGKILIHKAVAAGFQVKTLARNPEKLEDISDKIEIIEGNVFDPSAVEATIEGAEAELLMKKLKEFYLQMRKISKV